MKTTDIQGKPYVPVNERIKYFREHFKGYRLLSEIIELTDKKCVIKAKILNDAGDEVANGIACEIAGVGFINKTSHIENAETSAWGRALGNFGIGVDASVASADEVQNAINNQDTPNVSNGSVKPPVESVGNYCRHIKGLCADIDQEVDELIGAINAKKGKNFEKLEEMPLQLLIDVSAKLEVMQQNKLQREAMETQIALDQ